MFRPGASDRRFPLQWHLVLLVAGAVLPLIVFAAVLMLRYIDDAQRRASSRLIELTAMLNGDFERELQGTIGTLEALSFSAGFDRNDLVGIQRNIERVVRARRSWHAATVVEPGGRQILNTAFPAGSAPLALADSSSFARAIRTRRYAVGNLSFGTFGQYWAFPVRVPVIRGDSLLYVISAVVGAEALAGVVSRKLERDEWTRTIVDARGVVAARTRDPQRWLGTPGTQSFVSYIRSAPYGIYRATTLEGHSVYLSFRRSPVSDWTVAIAAPIESIDGPADAAVGAILLFGGLVVAASGFGAHILSRHVKRGISNAASAARSLAAGQSPIIARSSITEVAELFDALRQSAALLERRERERDENLARSQTARALAEDASRAKDEFLATLGHELRNPLAPIVLATEMLKEESGDSAGLAVIERQVTHLRRLIDDLLDISRIARSKVVLHFESLDLRSAILRAVEMSEPFIERRSHHLSVHLGSEPIDVEGDPVRLAQVFDNLLTNAARYTPAGGEISVGCTVVAGSVQIDVSDNGEGIAPELLPNIFDLFVQGMPPGRRSQGGLGIGLSLVRSLVQLHAGNVWATSPGLGAGSTFTVRLPLRVANTTPATLSVSSAPSSDSDALGSDRSVRLAEATAAIDNASPIRVLVVDDNEDAGVLLADYLQHHGIDAIAVGDGPAAIETLAAFEPEIAILDIGLPGMDGYQLAAAFAAHTSARPPALLALSGFGQPGDRERSLRSGFVHHFVKPAEPAEILATVIATARSYRAVVARESNHPDPVAD